jgi:hypothetical protein
MAGPSESQAVSSAPAVPAPRRVAWEDPSLPVQTTIGGDVYVHGRQDELSIPAFWAFFSQF